MVVQPGVIIHKVGVQGSRVGELSALSTRDVGLGSAIALVEVAWQFGIGAVGGAVKKLQAFQATMM